MSEFSCPVAAAETTEEFWTVFNSCIAHLRKETEQLQPGGADTASGAIDALQALRRKASGLQSYATESTKVLPSYDIRRSQEILEGINADLKQKENILRPKKKFAFSSKSAKPVSLVSAVVDQSQPTSLGAKPDSVVPASTGDLAPTHRSECAATDSLPPGSFVLANKSDGNFFFSEATVQETLRSQSVTEKEITQVGVYLKNIQNSTITIPMALGSVRMEAIANCKVYLGPVSTSVYIEGAQHCELHFACHQLRIHNCLATELYIRVGSHPIIEDCREMGFAPYSMRYANLNEQLKRAELLHGESLWDKVVDFRWHKSTPSPNWRIIPEAQRKLAPVADSNTSPSELQSIPDGDLPIHGKEGSAPAGDADDDEL